MIPIEDEIVLLKRQVGLDLPTAFRQELIDASAHVRQMIDHVPTDRPHADKPAHVFAPPWMCARERSGSRRP
jgi:hypothetical protein